MGLQSFTSTRKMMPKVLCVRNLFILGNLNQTKIQGRQLKAQLTEALNDSLRLHKADQYRTLDKRESQPVKKQTFTIEQRSVSRSDSAERRPKDTNKSSILRRIKKTH